MQSGLQLLANDLRGPNEKRRSFACQVLQASAATEAAAEPLGGDENAAQGHEIPLANGEKQPQVALKPQWDSGRRELSLGGRTVKHFLVPARNQELILSVFQEEGWPERIDDPLTPHQDIDPKTRRNDVIYRLNHKQCKCLIRFRANGTGDGVYWSLCDRKP